MKVTKDLVAASATPMVLGILAEGESYGYAILRRINELSGGELDWTEGLLYPVAAPARAARPCGVELAVGHRRAATQVLPHHRAGPGRARRAAPPVGHRRGRAQGRSGSTPATSRSRSIELA